MTYIFKKITVFTLWKTDFKEEVKGKTITQVKYNNLARGGSTRGSSNWVDMGILWRKSVGMSRYSR